VHAVEEEEKVAVGYDLGIEDKLGCFGVYLNVSDVHQMAAFVLLTPCCAGAHNLIRRTISRAADVADSGIKQALAVAEVLHVKVLDAPEAAGGECGDLGAFRDNGRSCCHGTGREGAKDAGEERGHQLGFNFVYESSLLVLRWN